jgi:hypothetical protein
MRSSYELAVLDPLIRVPALIPGAGWSAAANGNNANNNNNNNNNSSSSSSNNNGHDANGDVDADDDIDDTHDCLFLNFRHFKVTLKDTRSWRAASHEQQRLLASLAAVQMCVFSSSSSS